MLLDETKLKPDGKGPDLRLKASRLGLVVSLMALTMGLGTTYLVARATNFNFLGICGPSGSGWVVMIFLGSFPASPAARIITARRANHRWNQMQGQRESDTKKMPVDKEL
jgi:hypothetical protein